MNKKAKSRGIGRQVVSALLKWGRSNPWRMFFFLRVVWRLWRATRKRLRWARRINGIIPAVLAVSPTMRCNYNCQGCYSRGRSTEEELTTDEFHELFKEAEKLGVMAVIVTGGEPLLRDDMIEVMASHHPLLFVVITNGSFVNAETSRRITRSGNIVPLLSIEGSDSETDERRKPGAYNTVAFAFKHLREAGAFFGFAATNTAGNSGYLGTDSFINRMIDFGCSIGFYTEYVPAGETPRLDWILKEAERDAFRRRVLELRNSKPIVLIQFPQDEYGDDNLCSAAGRVSLHINPQGGIEPCPFMPVSLENIRQGGLLAACESPFMRAIRENPSLLQRKVFACSLYEHHSEIEALARKLRGNA